MKKSFFNQGEKGNVEIIPSGRSAEFAKQTLFSLPKEDAFDQRCTVHVESDGLRLTLDGKPFYGGSFFYPSKLNDLKAAKETAINEAEKRGYHFEPEAKEAFIASPVCEG